MSERLLDALNEPYDVHGHEMLVGVSNPGIRARRAKIRSRSTSCSPTPTSPRTAPSGWVGVGIEMFDDELRRQLAEGRVGVARSVGRLLDQPRLPIMCAPLVHLGDQSVVGFDCVVDWDATGLREEPELIARAVDGTGHVGGRLTWR